MSKKLPSAPSIEACLEELERKEEREEHSKQQYLANLKTQCGIRENALRTAESLIAAYQKENETLKEENHQLRDRVALLEEKLASHEPLAASLKAMEKTLLKYSQKINELLEKNIAGEQRIHLLEKEAQRASEAQVASEGERAKARLRAREEKQRREVEEHFKNYLRLPHGEESSFAASLGKEEAGERRVLEWKLKQKDEEVMILLKRLKDTEQKLDAAGKRGRQLTYDSIDAASTKQSKKMNVSEFEH